MALTPLITTNVAHDVLDLIGNTPMVDVSALSPNPNVNIYAKLEGQNPGGSVKDRIARAMVLEKSRPCTEHTPFILRVLPCALHPCFRCPRRLLIIQMCVCVCVCVCQRNMKLVSPNHKMPVSPKHEIGFTETRISKI